MIKGYTCTCFLYNFSGRNLLLGVQRDSQQSCHIATSPAPSSVKHRECANKKVWELRPAKFHWHQILGLIFCFCAPLFAQSPSTSSTILPDTVRLRSTSASSRRSIDTLITFFAQDTNRYEVSSQTLTLIGNAWIQYRNQRLEAHRIIVNFQTGTLIAEADSGGSARFQEGSETFIGKRIEYNFRTRKGRILIGKTQRSEGRYGGAIVKQISPTSYFVQNGVFTTCTNPFPHYAFFAPKMRIDRKNKIFVDPLFLTLEEFPVFGIPFGIFIDAQRGRRSGFLIPSVFFSNAPGSLNRGTIIENLGYYWAINDYLDARFAFRLTTKGGFTLFQTTRYAVRRLLTGSVQAAYGITRTSPIQPYTTDWNLQWQHKQQLGKTSRLDIALRFSSSNFFQNVSTNLQERVQRQIRSDASFYHQFPDGSSISLYYQRTQDLATGTVNETFPQFTFSLPQWYPLRSVTTMDWLRNFNIRYTVRGFRQRFDTTTKFRIEHRPRIALRPRFRFFTVIPSVSYSENWYFRRMIRTVRNDTAVVDSMESGFFREFQYSLGLSLSTRLYGIAFLQWGKLEAVRHILQPTITWNYTPDFSDPSLGMYGTFVDPKTGQQVKYSYFAKDGGGVNSQLRQSVRITLDNVFEAKIWTNDTTTRVIRLLNLGLSTAYNAAADSLQWSPITITGRTSIGNFFSFSGSARFLLYDQVPDADNPLTYRTINRFLWTTGKGLARLVNANLTATLTIGNQSSAPAATERSADTTLSAAPTEKKRYALEDTFWGQNAPGSIPLAIRWQLTATLQLAYVAPTPRSVSRTAAISLAGSFAIANSWALTGGLSLDLLTAAINAPYLELRKDLHCWDFYLRWYPTGLSQGIYLRIGIKAAQLRDIKIEKRTGSVYF